MTDPSATAPPAEAPAVGSPARPGVAAELALLAIVPVAAAVFAVVSSWRFPVPVADAAWLTQRVADAGAGRWPLVGMPSTIGGSEIVTHHPGPIGFYWLAPFWRLFGFHGIAIGTAASAAVALVWIGSTVRRYPGATLLAAVGAQVAIGVGIVTIGPEVLADPWNPYMALPWAMLLVVAAVRMWCGDARSWIALVAGASVAVQLHAGYVPWVLAIVVVLVVRCIVRPDGRPTGGWLLGAIATGVVLWIPPLVDLVAGDHNIAHLAQAATRSSAGDPAGLSPVLVAAAAALSPFHQIHDSPWIVADVRVVEVLVVVAVLAVAALSCWAATPRSWQRRWVAAFALGAVSWMAIATRAPMAGDVLPHSYVRPLWPLGAALWFGIGAVWWARRPPVMARWWWLPVAVMTVWAATVPTGYVGLDPAVRRRGALMVDALADTRAPRTGVTVVAGDPISAIWFAPVVTAELDRRGVRSGVGTDQQLDAPWMSTRPSPLSGTDCRWVVGGSPADGRELISPAPPRDADTARVAALVDTLAERYPRLRPSRLAESRAEHTGTSQLPDAPVRDVLTDGRFATLVVQGMLADATLRDQDVQEYVELVGLRNPDYAGRVTAVDCGDDAAG